MYLLASMMLTAPAMGFSLVGNRNKFRSSTSSTEFYVLPRGIGTEPTKTRVSISSRLHYRNGNDEDHPRKQNTHEASVTSNVGRWMKPAIRSSSFEDDEDTSKKVDEYLEFLDKRYNRMRNTDGPQSKKKPFSVLKWLGQEDHTELEQDNHSNALYALGVAGLASERLLQRQGVTLRKCSIIQPTPLPAENDFIVVEHACDDSPQKRMSMLLNKIFAAFSAWYASLHRQVSVKRSLMLRSLTRKSMDILIAAPVAIPRATSNFARALVKAGGGERNLKVAATVMCALAIYVAQPLAKSAITARTQV